MKRESKRQVYGMWNEQICHPANCLHHLLRPERIYVILLFLSDCGILLFTNFTMSEQNVTARPLLMAA